MSSSSSIDPASSEPIPIPSSILIIGSGVFGLSTAFSLCNNPSFANTEITLVDRLAFPAPDSSSIDTSRIIRADYADPAYSLLAAQAQSLWRGEWGRDGRYSESGLILTAEPGREAYVAASLENVRALEATQLEQQGGHPTGNNGSSKNVEVLRSRADIARAVGTGGASGTTGYINRRSGWADAEAAMRHLRRKVEALNRVRFVVGTVSRLLIDHASHTIEGALLASGDPLRASLTILAAGAWTPALLDLRGVATATGQVLAYVPLSQEEQERLSRMPVILNLSTGLFVIPPSRNELKVARHAFGYSNPVRIPHPEASGSSTSTSTSTSDDGGNDARSTHITVSLPRTGVDDPALEIPPEGERACRAALARIVPALADRPFHRTRLCWYTDTPTGDFLITYHPRYGRSLFVATGGSGHGFKFLPVIGDKIVECVMGRTPAEFREKWAWPRERLEEGKWTGDGSRGGEPGMILEEELRKGERARL